MCKIFGLPICDYLYKEYFPTLKELHVLKTKNSSVYMILYVTSAMMSRMPRAIYLAQEMNSLFDY